jgi:hypothetical protein
MKLFPRLISRFAQAEFEKQVGLLPEERNGSTQHVMAVWPATGAQRMSNDDLEALRNSLLAVARDLGYPAPIASSVLNQVDLRWASVLHQSSLSPAEASFPDVWSFIALVLVPELTWWRAAGSTNVERFVGSDLTRHTWARLWWRAHLFTFGLAEPKFGWALWRDSAIGEAELDQIQTRRGGYGRCPKAFRALVRAYPDVTAAADELGFDRRVFWRQAYLRWVLRLGAFLDFSGLPEDQVQGLLTRLISEVASRAAPADAIDCEAGPSSASVDIPVSAPESFDDFPLSLMVLRLTEAVRLQGQVEAADLEEAFSAVTGLTVPADRGDILRGIAWQGQPLGYLAATKVDGAYVWRGGSTQPAPDRRWHDWSIKSFADHVAAEGITDVESACGALFAGRAGQTVKRAARAALKKASRQ